MICMHFYNDILAPSEEPVSDKKYDDATQLLVDAADETRKDFDSVDRKHR